MPLARIDLSKDASDAFVRTVSQAVYNAMTTIANVPENDRFQIVTRHPPEELIYPAEGYLGMTYTNNIVFIQITWVSGRATELKRRFCRKIVDDICGATDFRPDDIFISLVNAGREDWSFGKGRMQYAPKDQPGGQSKGA